MDKDTLLLASTFTHLGTDAANDSTPDPDNDLEPHEHLQQVLDGEIQGFIRDFRISMMTVLCDLNEQTHLTLQSGHLNGEALKPEESLTSAYVEVGLGEPFPKLLWRAVVVSYHDHLLKNNYSRYCEIYKPLGADALQFFLKTGTHNHGHGYNAAMTLFSDAYSESLKAFSVIRDLILQNVKGSDARIEMREPQSGLVLPVVVITAKDHHTDIRLLLQGYINSTQDRDRHGLTPV